MSPSPQRIATLAVGVLVGVSLNAGCSAAHGVEDAGSAAADASAVVDASDGAAHPPCHWDPTADHSDVGHFGVPCQMNGCRDVVQSFVTTGVAYGACGREWLPGEVICDFETCIPASELATGPDGGLPPQDAGWAAFCCGDGPACSCTELCWAPDATQAPHCIPR